MPTLSLAIMYAGIYNPTCISLVKCRHGQFMLASINSYNAFYYKSTIVRISMVFQNSVTYTEAMFEEN